MSSDSEITHEDVFDLHLLEEIETQNNEQIVWGHSPGD